MDAIKPVGKGIRQRLDNVVRQKYFLEGLLVAATIAWGLSFVWIKQITDAGVEANAFIALRNLLAVALMTPFCLKELKAITRQEVKYGLLLGVLLYLAMTTQTYGLQYTTPANSAFITTSYVIFVPFTAWMILGERPAKRVWISVALCLGGLWVLTMSPGEGLGLNIGNLLTMGCAVCWSVQVSVLSKAGKTCGIKILTLVPLMVMAVISTVAALITGGLAFEGVDFRAGLPPLLACVLFPTLLASAAQTYAQKYIDPTKAAIIYTLESVFGCLFSVLLGYEQMNATLVIGGGLIFTAIVLTEVGGRGKKEERDHGKSAVPDDLSDIG